MKLMKLAELTKVFAEPRRAPLEHSKRRTSGFKFIIAFWWSSLLNYLEFEVFIQSNWKTAKRTAKRIAKKATSERSMSAKPSKEHSSFLEDSEVLIQNTLLKASSLEGVCYNNLILIQLI